MRIGRSFLSPTGATNELEAELDFQLGPQQGIEIVAVQGYGILHDDTPAVSDTVPITARATQTLHLETGATEDIPVAAAADAVDIDTEIFWIQFFALHIIMGATVTFGAGISHSVMPPGITYFDVPILSPRNITHKATTEGADQDLEAGVMVHYYYVTFSNAELGVLLARR